MSNNPTNIVTSRQGVNRNRQRKGIGTVPEHVDFISRREAASRRLLFDTQQNEEINDMTFPQLLEEIDNMRMTSPERTAHKVILSDKISPQDAPHIVKELTALNVLAGQVARAPSKVKRNLMFKDDNKTYPRCRKFLAKKIELNRKKVLCGKKNRDSRRKTQQLIRKKKVINFLKREDNSATLPSKKDNQVNEHKYALNDTMKNLFHKFASEFPHVNIKFSTFSKYRPKNVKPITWSARRQCLCIKHQNAALKLKAIRINQSPNFFIRNNTEQDIATMLQKLPNQPVRFQVWRTEEVTVHTVEVKTVKNTVLESDILPRDQFIEIFEDEFILLRDHIRRITTQFQQMKKLRENLDTEVEITVQLDYAENYSCIFQDEPSQVFYDRNLLTVHPMIAHFRDHEGNLLHKSFAGISNITNHAAPTTVGFLSSLMPRLKQIRPNLEVVHYLSDSPANQYRNKSIVKFIADHARIFEGVQATWDYFEVGHGKGPCDGIGGSLKKSAEICVKRGEVIKTAEDFVQCVTPHSQVEMFLLTEEEIVAASKHVKNSTYVKGISTAHSIRYSENYICLRETSCYEDCCRQIINVNHDCRETSVPIQHEISRTKPALEPRSDLSRNISRVFRARKSVTVPERPYKKGDVVRYAYKREHFVGEILKVRSDLDEYLVKFVPYQQGKRAIFPRVAETEVIMKRWILGLHTAI